jgi:flavin reductase (DIM6/NTAB) family NADH-FMN oxidoreductase RutF
MSKHLGDRLPAEFMAALDGRDLERKYGETYVVLTADPDGVPRPCMLSAGELLAPDDRTVRIALWPNGRTGANLRRGNRAVICFVAPNLVLYVRGTPRELAPAHDPEIERFEVTVDAVDSDAHEGLPVVHGIAFSSTPEIRRAMLEQWREVLEALRGA